MYLVDTFLQMQKDNSLLTELGSDLLVPKFPSPNFLYSPKLSSNTQNSSYKRRFLCPLAYRVGEKKTTGPKREENPYEAEQYLLSPQSRLTLNQIKNF